ncbi:hypothetical protein [Pedobacter nototheniae]|uniref:hypothetical protein n=1 Tax=Pedobacter nototheniae TaxID=2488994 RepID=UPI00292EF415|nr:hypothetical protein [Pedobacter nototheniae]
MKYMLTLLNIFGFFFFGYGQNKTIHVSNYSGSKIEIKSTGEKPGGNLNVALQCFDIKTKDSIGNYSLFVNGIKINDGYGHSNRLLSCKGTTSISVSAEGYKTAIIEDKYLESGVLSHIKVSLARIPKNKAE